MFLFLGENIVVFLNMSAQNLPPVISRNTIAEIKGTEYPEQVTVIRKMTGLLWPRNIMTLLNVPMTPFPIQNGPFKRGIWIV